MVAMACSEAEELAQRNRVRGRAGLERDNLAPALGDDEAASFRERALHRDEALHPEPLTDELREAKCVGGDVAQPLAAAPLRDPNPPPAHPHNTLQHPPLHRAFAPSDHFQSGALARNGTRRPVPDAAAPEIPVADVASGRDPDDAS